MHLDDIDDETFDLTQQQLRKVKVLRLIAKKIIRMLAQLEDFQKKLWLKKKFVVSTEYIVSIDRIDSKLYDVILSNQDQIDEWANLGFLSDTSEENEDLLEKHPYLLIDTKHFNLDFKNEIISNYRNINDSLTGLLVNSDNFQALNLCGDTYEKKCDFVYIDPPYNTSDTGFIYKNNYQHSSWMSMVYDRIKASKRIMTGGAAIGCAIDDLEMSTLQQIMDFIFGENNRLGNLIVEIKPSGRTNDTYLATSHEYILIYANSYDDAEIDFFELTDEQLAQYSQGDGDQAFKWRDFLRTGGFSTPEERPNSYYPIYFNQDTNEVDLKKFDGAIEIYPIDSLGNKRVWRKTKPSFLGHLEKEEIDFKKNKDGKWKVLLIDRVKKGTRPKSVWTGSKYDASSHGTKLLKHMFGEVCDFSFPKSLNAVYDTLYINVSSNESALVTDYFAGSGTTGHAVMLLNKILVEIESSSLLNKENISSQSFRRE